MDSASAFLDRAIEENQLTIRAIDIKVTALLAAILAPLAAISRVFAHLENFYCIWPQWPMFAVNMIFLLLWWLALVCLVLAIGAIDNPAIHIPQVKQYRGSFYAGGLFNLTWVDAILNRSNVMARKNPENYMAELPRTPDEIVNELVFEQMKLAYIRDIKLNRLKWAFRFAGGWLFLGICIFLVSHYRSAIVG